MKFTFLHPTLGNVIYHLKNQYGDAPGFQLLVMDDMGHDVARGDIAGDAFDAYLDATVLRRGIIYNPERAKYMANYLAVIDRKDSPWRHVFKEENNGSERSE